MPRAPVSIAVDGSAYFLMYWISVDFPDWVSPRTRTLYSGTSRGEDGDLVKGNLWDICAAADPIRLIRPGFLDEEMVEGRWVGGILR